MSFYKDKVAVVTASAAGIGEAIVRELVAEGAFVIASDINRRGGADALAAELGERCIPVTVDVSKEEDIVRMVDMAVEKFGRLDVAFNVAGTAKFGTVLDGTAEDFRFALELCVVGTYLCMQHEARQMIKSGVQGSIVNVSSINSQVPAWGMNSYCAAKAAVDMLGKNAAIELAEHNIRVNTVAPGLTLTKSNSAIPERMLNAFMGRIPMKRMASAREQARACLFLGSDDASYVTGASLVVDGGWTQTGYPDTRLWFGDAD